MAQYLIVHDLLEQVQRAFDLGDITRAGGLPALYSTPRDRKTPGMPLSKETNVGATQAFWTFWTRLARLAWRQGVFGWAHKGSQSDKGGRWQRNREEIGKGATRGFIFRGFATQ